jgi:hypothetical protein
MDEHVRIDDEHRSAPLHRGVERGAIGDIHQCPAALEARELGQCRRLLAGAEQQPEYDRSTATDVRKTWRLSDSVAPGGSLPPGDASSRRVTRRRW